MSSGSFRSQGTAVGTSDERLRELLGVLARMKEAGQEAYDRVLPRLLAVVKEDDRGDIDEAAAGNEGAGVGEGSAGEEAPRRGSARRDLGDRGRKRRGSVAAARPQASEKSDDADPGSRKKQRATKEVPRKVAKSAALAPHDDEAVEGEEDLEEELWRALFPDGEAGAGSGHDGSSRGGGGNEVTAQASRAASEKDVERPRGKGRSAVTARPRRSEDKDEAAAPTRAGAAAEDVARPVAQEGQASLPLYVASAACRAGLASEGCYVVQLPEGGADVAGMMIEELKAWLYGITGGPPAGGRFSREHLAAIAEILVGCECTGPLGGGGLVAYESRGALLKTHFAEGLVDVDECMPADLQGPFLIPSSSEEAAAGTWPSSSTWRVHRAPVRKGKSEDADVDKHIDWSGKNPLFLYVPKDAKGSASLEVLLGSHEDTGPYPEEELPSSHASLTKAPRNVRVVPLLKNTVVVLHVGTAYRLRYAFDAVSPGREDFWMVRRLVLADRSILVDKRRKAAWRWKATGRQTDGKPTQPGTFRDASRTSGGGKLREDPSWVSSGRKEGRF